MTYHLLSLVRAGFFIITSTIAITSLAQEIEMPTSHFDSSIRKHIVRTSANRSDHRLSYLPLASPNERNHALFFGTTLQTRAEASRGMILESTCTGFHIEVDDNTMILSLHHCLKDSSHFYPYFLGFEGVWIYSHFDYAVAAFQSKFDVMDSNYDVALFYEKHQDMKRSQYFNPLRLADRLPVLYERLSFIGYPNGVGPVKIECTYYGLGLNKPDLDTKYRLDGRLHCPVLRGLGLHGASGSAITNRDGKVVGVMKASNEPLVFFTPMVEGNLKIVDNEAVFDFEEYKGNVSAPHISDRGDRFSCTFSINRSGEANGRQTCRNSYGETYISDYRNGSEVRDWRLR